MTTPIQIHLTIFSPDGEHFQLLDGPPSKFGLDSSAAQTFTMGDEVAVFWTVGCELTGDEVRRLTQAWGRMM